MGYTRFVCSLVPFGIAGDVLLLLLVLLLMLLLLTSLVEHLFEELELGRRKANK